MNLGIKNSILASLIQLVKQVTQPLAKKLSVVFNYIVKDTALLKFLDELALPFVIISAARYLGIFASTYLRPVQFNFNSRSSLISAPFLDFKCRSDLEFTNSVSWFFVAISLAVFFGFILFRNLHFHADWIHPKAAYHLHNKKLEFLIVVRQEAFYQAFSWACLALILLILSTAELLAGDLSVLVYSLFYGIDVSLIILFLLGAARDKKLSGDKV